MEQGEYSLAVNDKLSIIKAICNSGYTVTAADVANATGLPLSSIYLELNKLAEMSRGQLKVTDTGQVVYCFPVNFVTMFAALALWRITIRILLTSMSVVLKGIFVIFLLPMVVLAIPVLYASIVAMAAFAICWVCSLFSMNFHALWFFLSPIFIALAWFSPKLVSRLIHIISNWDPYAESSSALPERKSDFGKDLMSLLIGEGNPNPDLNSTRWKLIANAIWSNHGVITAEQLAPYTGCDPAREEQVLPVLRRFNGEPRATEAGNLVYVFPEMRTCACEDDMIKDPPTCLLERTWTFSRCHPESLTPIAVLGLLNSALLYFCITGIIAGAEFYGWQEMIRTPHLLVVTVYLTTAMALVLTLPALRKLVVLWRNRLTHLRNLRRQGYAAQLTNPSAELALKLKESREYWLPEEHIAAEHIVYTTEEGLLEQEPEGPALHSRRP